MRILARAGIAAAAALLALALNLSLATAAVGSKEMKSVDWPHLGAFGTFDRTAAQRGLIVYREVCSSCHGLRYIAFRNLIELGLSVDEVKALAAQYDVPGEPNEDGDIEMRPGKPFDYFPSPFPNEKAARASNNGALPPDLSLIIKARFGAESYVYSLLSGYEDAPGDVKLAEGMNYNPYFAGQQIAMAAPLFEDGVEYPDGTKATVDQMAADVVTFLAWAAEPTLEARKAMGVKVMIFLFLFALLLYAVKRKVWADVH